MKKLDLNCLRHALLGFFLISICSGSAWSQQTITYSNGRNDATAYDTSAPNDPTVLTIDSGAATQSGILSGTGGVIKTGAGALTLSAANTYDGDTILSAGTLEITNANSLGISDIAFHDGELLGTTNFTWDNNLVSFLINSSGKISAANGTTLTLQPALLFTKSSADLRFGSTGNDGIVLFQPGIITQSGNGTVTVEHGTLRAGNGVLSEVTASIVSTTVNAGATLDYNDFATGFDIHNLQGAGTVNIGSNAATTLGIREGNFSGVIQGAGGLNKLGTNTLTPPATTPTPAAPPSAVAPSSSATTAHSALALSRLKTARLSGPREATGPLLIISPSMETFLMPLLQISISP
jgi:autotransporter-associated beta strand protein